MFKKSASALPTKERRLKNATSCGNVCMTRILSKAVAFGRAMIMLPSLSCVPQAQDVPPGKAFFAFLGGTACDLEGVGAGARQFSKLKVHSYSLNKKPAQAFLFFPALFIFPDYIS
ncbi:hypothetical protein [Cytobacillus firmus]|uniref:Uncharacterized protein n=1 Tax=Cytobacillus firmus DS1 TaxID=1307436 RepID=W7L212_CYTFI|nr:hypothetical protein [Cytobacillus firmus]EWG12423.1 hypothetical protein PBF_02770 [Cytobacillus firmus DS1]